VAKYRSEVHLVTDDRTYVWDGSAFVMPCNDNAKRFCYIGHAKKAAYELNRAQSYSRHPLMEKGKYQAIAIDLDAPKPEPVAPDVTQRAAEITVGTDEQQIPDGKPYLPSNGTEGEIFTGHWCNRCEHDIDENCEILVRSLCHEQPDEWQYQNGKPVCTAWRQRNTPPPKPEPVTTTVEVRYGSPKAYEPAKFDRGDNSATAIAPAPTDHPFSTPRNHYQGYAYWIAGDPGDGRKTCCYWYFVALLDEDSQTIRTIQSTESFSSVVPAAQAARVAIDRLSSINLVEVSA